MMIKSFFPFLLISAFLVGCSHSGKQFFTDEACDFKVLFPAEPTISNQSIAFPFGSFSGKKFTYEVKEGANKSYSVTCIELPQNVVHSDSLKLLSQLFALTQADYQRQYGDGGLMNTYIKTINKYPGREFVWGIPQNDAGYTRRVYYVRNKLYLLEVEYTSGNQHNLEIGSFLDSFHLLSKEINQKPEPVPHVPKKKFTIAFPGGTMTKNNIVAGAEGPEYVATEMYKVSSYSQLDEFGNTAYGVNYMNMEHSDISKLSEDMQKKFLYENSVNNPLVLNRGRVLSIQESTIDGTYCVELKALTLGGHVEFIAKTFFKDKYLYQVMVLSSPNKSENEASRKFMESFHLK